MQTYIGLVIGALAVVVVLLGCTALFVARRGRGRQKVALLTKHTALVSAKPGTIDMADLKVNVNGAVNGKVRHDETDSETSSVYHEPYKLLPSAKQEYNCLLRKDALSSSKSGEYTGLCHI